jgi:hypothetical protein
MSLSLATKGTLHGGVTLATKGVIYYFGAALRYVEDVVITEPLITMIPELIFRRASITKVFRRVSVQKIFRREDGDH